MIKSISYRFTLCLGLLFSIANLSADTLTVTWTGAIGELETTIMADTLADGTQAHAVYKLEANKVYLQRSTIVLESSCHIVGAAYADGASIQLRYSQYLETMEPLSSLAGLLAISKPMAKINHMLSRIYYLMAYLLMAAPHCLVF